MHAFVKTLLTLTSAVAIAVAAVPACARAADSPSYSVPANGDDTVRGVVTAFDGHYALEVRDDRGFLDRVRLHDGTIINPTGLTLAPGERVTILGANAGDTLSANEIDTPYAPALAYPAFGYPAYGPAYGVDFGFGFGHRFGRFR